MRLVSSGCVSSVQVGEARCRERSVGSGTGSRRNVDIKFGRARLHLTELAATVRAFEERAPFTAEGTIEPNGDQVWRAVVREQPPIEWGAVAGDVIHNARVALDYLVWQLVLANGGTPSSTHQFPIGESAGELYDLFEAQHTGDMFEARPVIARASRWA